MVPALHEGSRIKFREAQEYKQGDILISSGVIQSRLEEMASDIVNRFYGQRVIVTGILKGAFMVMADLTRALHTAGLDDFTTSFMTVSSYGSGTESSRNIRLISPMDVDPRDRHVLLVDDIFDTTYSLQFCDAYARERGALSVVTFALLSKPERHETEYKADYIGFKIPNVWAQGYGMDTDQFGRGDPNIVVGPILPQTTLGV